MRLNVNASLPHDSWERMFLFRNKHLCMVLAPTVTALLVSQTKNRCLWHFCSLFWRGIQELVLYIQPVMINCAIKQVPCFKTDSSLEYALLCNDGGFYRPFSGTRDAYKSVASSFISVLFWDSLCMSWVNGNVCVPLKRAVFFCEIQLLTKGLFISPFNV